MATASFQTMSPGHQGKITKSRTRSTVKPILKKLHSSHSEKNSLDLNRTWEDQPPSHLGYHTDDRSSLDCQDPAANARSARDVSFNLSATDLTNRTTTNQVSAAYSTTNSTSTAGSNFSSNKHSHHTRSTSGASHISLATSASGRNGSFVHPFQQTPRTSTPPLVSYANSFASFDNIQRDSSPTTITEDEDPVESLIRGLPPSQLKSSAPSPRPAGVPGAQRSGSLSDAVQAPLRVATGWSNSGSASRSAHIGSPVNHTRSSDGQLSARPSVTVHESSPLTSTAPQSSQMTSPMASPASTHTMPTLRSSLDMNQFRLRSRSDVDTATRQEQVRAARRKFDEKEKAKEEKYAKAETRKRERADTKEAQRLEKVTGHHRKGSCSGRTSSSTDIRPVFSRKNTGASATRFDSTSEKAGDFVSRGYKEMAAGQSPRARTDDVRFESSRRSVKRKPTGTWTAFVLWLRTRLLKLGRR